MTNRSLETLTAADFRGAKGATFRLTGTSAAGGPPASSEVELVDVTEHQAGSPGPSRTPFSVLFHGPLEPVLPQGIYRLEEEQFGTLELFVVPIGPDEPSAHQDAPTAMRYEVVFG